MHTPTPWKYRKTSTMNNPDYGTHSICNDNVDNIAFTSEKNAAHIVKCVNSHDALVEALRLILPLAKGYSAQRTVESSFSYILQAEQALKEAA